MFFFWEVKKKNKMKVVFSRGQDASHGLTALYGGVSHVAILLDDGVVVSMSRREGRMKKTPLLEYLRKWAYVVIWKPPPATLQLTWPEFDTFVNSDVAYCIRNSSPFCTFCTRHVQKALHIVGVDLPFFWHPFTLQKQLSVLGWQVEYESGSRYDHRFALIVAGVVMLVAVASWRSAH